MAKTPEKVISATASVQSASAAPTMRYRRKAPTAASKEPTAQDDHDAMGTSETKQQDNQTEHRQAESTKDTQQAQRHSSDGDKAVNAGGTRKKKPKSTTTPPSNNNNNNNNDNEAEAVVNKKKLKKRQLSKKKDGEEPPSGVVESPSIAKPLAPPQPRKRKQHGINSNSSTTGPSLLKQLLWKAKPTAPSPPPLPSINDADTSTSGPPESPADDDEEEVAYNARERHNRKLQASKRVSSSTAAVVPSPPSCSDVHPLRPEMSSQETQSGSEEDEPSSSFLEAFENLVPTDAIHPSDLIPLAVRLETYFPTPFPTSLVHDTKVLDAHDIKVHEVLIEDFAFHPQQLRVRKGDVVVWKVSEQTLAMVEHSLEMTLQRREWKYNKKKSKEPTVVKVTTPPLGSSSLFALRFKGSASVKVECTVYKTTGTVFVGKAKAKVDKQLTTDETVESVDTVPPISKAARKRKEKAERRRAALAAASESAPIESTVENDADEMDGRDSVDSDSVFHRPEDLMHSTEMDAGVCRAVLTQLEEVAAANAAVNHSIIVGDVECPLMGGDSAMYEALDENPASDHLVRPEDKQYADEWSGTDEDDDAEDEEDDNNARVDAIEDFQQRIIGMLKRSEEARAEHRRSFQQEQSGFDAGAAYDFFKRRFMQVQEEREIVYSVCPEPQTGTGVGVTDVVNLLSGQ